MKAYCRACDAAVEAEGAWPGACVACGAAIEAAPVPDVISRGVRVLFVGINPGTQTARHLMHFANPRNLFWTLLHEAGFTPTQVAPADAASITRAGLGITNVVTRATPGSGDVTAADIEHGRARLAELVRTARPKMLAFVGKEAYRMATGTRGAPLGEQPAWHGARVFVLPSTSPANAAVSREEKLRAFRELKNLT